MTCPSRRPGQLPELPPTPLWFKVWVAVCAALGLAFAGLIVWVIVELVLWVRTK